MSYPTKDVCVIQFTESSTLEGTRKRVLNAWREGIYAFQFRFVHGMGKDRRTFCDEVAVDGDYDVECIIAMADYHFQRFFRTAFNLIARKI